MHRFVVAVVVGAVVVGGCSSSSSKSASTTTTTSAASATTAVTTPGHPATTTAGAAPTTTAAAHAATTVAPAGASAPAVSASFVSPQQGFVLLRNGRIDATSNAGHTWHRAGNLGRSGSDEIIRYIGPSDGFAFQRINGGLFITHDAGATWTRTPTPFSNVADLAILHGMIYVVALHSGPTVNFQIWSTPIEHLVWKQDPLSLPVGAGPIASAQIALAGSAGWILIVNRVVIAGARLGTNGRWAKWTPPCKAFGGVAGFTASSSNDLAAVCSPGPGTPASEAMTTAFQSSHNGGTTFTSHTIPNSKFGAGGPLSPTAGTAVIIESTDLRRTTNDGSTWQVVASANGAGALDYGFTTTTQAFIVLQGGGMLMTYDGGATWTRVTLP